VGRVWRAFGLHPHRIETFKLSTDPLFIEKVRGIVGSMPARLDAHVKSEIARWGKVVKDPGAQAN
jgi:hypothetical protein